MKTKLYLKTNNKRALSPVPPFSEGHVDERKNKTPKAFTNPKKTEQ